MEPGIQFARTADRVSIAFLDNGRRAAIGCDAVDAVEPSPTPVVDPRGAAVVHRPEPQPSPCPLRRAQVRPVTAGRPRRFSLDAQVLDLRGRPGPGRDPSASTSTRSPPQGHRRRLFPLSTPTALLTSCCSAHTPDGAAYGAWPIVRATRPIIEQDWEFYTEAVARLLLGWAEPEAAHRFAHLVKECTTPNVAIAALAATATFDVTGALADLQVPTLVIHRRGLHNPLHGPRPCVGLRYLRWRAWWCSKEPLLPPIWATSKQ